MSAESIRNGGRTTEGVGCGISGAGGWAAGAHATASARTAALDNNCPFIFFRNSRSRLGRFGSATEQLSTVCYSSRQSEGSETPHRRAFTLPEVTITLCIIGALTAIAVPQAGKLIDAIQVRGAVADIESVFSSGRHIAIARSAQSTVEIDTANRRIYVSVGGDTVRRADVGIEHGVQLSTTRPRMSYTATGVGYGAANLSVVVRRSQAVDTVFVSRLGRLRH